MRGLWSDAAARRVSAFAVAHPVLNSDILVRELGGARRAGALDQGCPWRDSTPQPMTGTFSPTPVSFRRAN
jgi:hypothetical protein